MKNLFHKIKIKREKTDNLNQMKNSNNQTIGIWGSPNSGLH